MPSTNDSPFARCLYLLHPQSPQLSNNLAEAVYTEALETSCARPASRRPSQREARHRRAVRPADPDLIAIYAGDSLWP